MARKIESLFVDGPAGRLEALLEEPETAPREVALVCHPHPQYAGTMHNKVVYRVARGLRQAGAVVLRFNYRGVNLSQGTYDQGEGEIEDGRAALAYLRSRFPDLPFTVAGFSFGSRIALKLCAGSRRVIPVGFPTHYADPDLLNCCTVPRTFVHSTHDEHGPLPELEKIVAQLAEPKRLIVIEAKDHFFAGGLDELEQAIQSID